MRFDARGGHVVCSRRIVMANTLSESPALPMRLAPAESRVKHRVLVVDDEESPRTGLTSLLSTWGYEVAAVQNGQQGLERALAFRPLVVVTDLVMPGLSGIDLLRELKHELPGAAVVILTGHASIETAMTAVREGAYDYLTKPLDPRRLRIVLEKAIEKAEVVRDVTLLRRQLKDTRGMGPLLGTSPGMKEVYRLIGMAVLTAAPVLISGETGTGKELVARTIHERSRRGKQPFVAVNCSALPDTLLESELFGHEKGSFTGALERRAGLFELADAGTLFLDEITEMSGALQAKYLRTLRDGTLRRLGGKAELQVDVRVVAATNKDPMRAVQDGNFREDLYDRLSVLNITLPPLRQRPEDIPLLVEAFIQEFNVKYARSITAMDEAAMKLVCQHRWPGNVRELRNAVERAVVACGGDVVMPTHLPLARPMAPSPASADSIVLPLGSTLESAERELLLRTLASTNNNKTHAAEILGVTPKTLHNKLRRYAREGPQAR
jgi:DNA-binding NtrC family response regulator